MGHRETGGFRGRWQRTKDSFHFLVTRVSILADVAWRSTEFTFFSGGKWLLLLRELDLKGSFFSYSFFLPVRWFNVGCQNMLRKKRKVEALKRINR